MTNLEEIIIDCYNTGRKYLETALDENGQLDFEEREVISELGVNSIKAGAMLKVGAELVRMNGVDINYEEEYRRGVKEEILSTLRAIDGCEIIANSLYSMEREI